eukprot:2528367-Rhodomonas_salina.1
MAVTRYQVSITWVRVCLRRFAANRRSLARSTWALRACDTTASSFSTKISSAAATLQYHPSVPNYPQLLPYARRDLKAKHTPERKEGGSTHWIQAPACATL